MKQTIFALITCLILAENNNKANIEDLKRDNTLFIPGIGAESIVLNESSDNLLNRIGPPDTILAFKKRKELFKDVFHVQSPKKIYFTQLFYFQKKQFIVFLNKGCAIAIAGFKRSRCDYNSVNLEKGTDYFLFNYGNNNLYTLHKAGSSIYIYPSRGVAIADDKLDNLIDIYIVFSAKIVDSNINTIEKIK